MNQNRGFSTLTLVFIISALLAMLVFALYPVSLLGVRRSNQIRFSQQAFFAAEGALYETIQHLRDYPDWPDSFGTDTYTIGDAPDESTIRRVLSDEGEGKIKIDITATVRGTKRRLVATYAREIETETPLDIVLVIDHSGSMNDGGCDGEGCHPLSEAQTAAINFLDYLDNGKDRVGVVGYSTGADDSVDLTLDYSTVRTEISDFRANGKTNIAEAIYQAAKNLDDNGRGEATKVIVLLSDGVANRSHISCSDCGDYPCLRPTPANAYAPNNDPFNPPSTCPNASNPCLGTCCTNDAVVQAKEAKTANYYVFSIFLNKISDEDYEDLDCTIASTIELGRKTLQQIANNSSSFYETPDEDELEKIYEEIAAKITSPEFLQLEENLPEPQAP